MRTKPAVFGLLFVAACGGRTNDLPPHGEALVVVDTDLPVPQLASRLRLDLYDEGGHWFESRDIGRTDPRDWPASFSVYSDDDTRDKRVLVRVRVYPDGITRDYKGERFESRPELHEPFRARSIDELCANAPALPLGGRVTMRAGSEQITDVVATTACDLPSAAGSMAAKVVVTQAGRFRFDVANAFPYATYVSLALRSSCADATTQLACQREPFNGTAVFTPGHFPRFDAQLDPGTYWLVASTLLPAWPADVTLEAMPLDAPLPDPTPLTKDPPRDPEAPRLHRPGDERDATPSSEPLPTAAIDRLLLVRLMPGIRGSVHVTLRGACAGTMARIGEDPSRPAIASASTCIDTENVRVAVAEAPLDPDMTRPTTTEQGTFAKGDACATPAREDVVCVPGGVFLFGSRLVSSFSATGGASSPERIAAMTRFWMDKREVSVGRLRAAMTRGFAMDPSDIHVNDGAFGGGALGGTLGTWCTWSSTAKDREDFPVSCINQRAARAFCRFEGGDLPTDAQWEYAAGAACRAFQAPYPWGDDAPTCERSAIGRAPGTAKLCYDPNADPPRPYGPSPLAKYPLGDVTPLGILAMGGNVQEWTLDAAEPYTSDCWRAATLHDPKCIEDDAPMGSIRGGCWMSNGYESVSNRNELPVALASNGIPSVAEASPIAGFRCVYAEEPR